ncbi:MAG: DUF4139 domain-containing protein [Bacteroidales bacterium]|nr:DUF4139 domain-containing protein [Bacteroidales bacterium]
MKRFIITLLALFIAVVHLAAQAEKDIKGEIKHVTVFPDRAQIDHEASVSLQAGKTILKLSALSPYIDVQSIQVKGFGEFTILSVNHQNNYLQNLEDAPDVKSIRNQIESLQLKAEDEKAAITILKEKAAFLVANREILVKETSFSIEQLKSVMDLYTRNMEQVTVTSLMKERQIKDYEKQIASLQKQIADKLGRQQLPSGEIYVTVISDKQISGRLTFSYVVGNAGWYPSYDIRVDDIKNPVSIYYKANVFQNSGVDWKDIKISFSNATPWVGGDFPVLYPWFIDYYTPPNSQIMIRGAASVRKSKAPELMEMAVARDEEMVKEAPSVAVEKKIGETTITFDVSAPCTVPSDGKLQTVEIQRIVAPAEYKYVTTPKLSQLAYLTANITDWAKLSLQSGEATLYFENSFVGKSNVNVAELNDTLALSLGTDNGIIIKREKRVDFTSRKTIGANKTETYSFLLTVRNNKPVPVKITMKDQLPVSSNSGITVDPVEISGGKYNPITGEIRWDLEINKQETKQVILTYSVKYPKDRTIILE